MPFIYAVLTWFLLAPVRSFVWNVTIFTAYSIIALAAASAFTKTIIALLQAQYVPVPQMVLDVWHWFMPSNTVACIIAIFSAHTIRGIYDSRMWLLNKLADGQKS